MPENDEKGLWESIANAQIMSLVSSVRTECNFDTESPFNEQTNADRRWGLTRQPMILRESNWLDLNPETWLLKTLNQVFWFARIFIRNSFWQRHRFGSWPPIADSSLSAVLTNWRGDRSRSARAEQFESRSMPTESYWLSSTEFGVYVNWDLQCTNKCGSFSSSFIKKKVFSEVQV